MNYTEIVSEHKPRVIISKELASQIAILHNSCPSNKEWSGLLIYQITNGGIDKEGIKELEIRAEAVFPMDFGDATFTSFEGSPAWFKLFDEFPQVDPIKKEANWFIGKIHSHHNMNTFHSATDKTDLYENAPKLPIFLSLITNYACDWDVKLAIAVEAKQKKTTWWKWNLKGFDIGKEENKEEEEAPLLTYILNCNVAFDCEEWFLTQLNEVKKPKVTGFVSNRGNDKSEMLDGDVLSRFAKNRMLACLDDLLTLGSDVVFRTPYAALKEVDRVLQPGDLPVYTEALQIYFEEWYLVNFYNIGISESNILDSILTFLNYHQKMWIVEHLIKALDECLREYSLREVQEPALV